MQIKTLHIEFTTACNSKCIMCDYWENGRLEVINTSLVFNIISEQCSNGLKTVYFSGGECLMFADQLFPLVRKIRETFPHLKIGIVTNGILIKNHYKEIAHLFSKVIISLDAVDSQTYKKIRGIDGFETVKDGIRILKHYSPNTQMNLRVLVLDENVNELPKIIEFAVNEQLNRISFIPEDTSNENAFGRNDLSHIENHRAMVSLPTLRHIIQQIKMDFATEMNGLLRPNVEDLEYVYSIYSNETKNTPCCNKAASSCVIEADGRISPCFFIRGNQFISDNVSLQRILNSNDYCQTVQDINSHKYLVCNRCACPKELS